VITALFLIVSQSYADNISAVVVEVNGKAEVSYAAGVWIPLKIGTKINEKDVVRTGDKSSVRFKYDETKFSIIDANSEVRFENLKTQMVEKKTLFKKKEVPVQNINLKVLKGGVFSKVKNLDQASNFSINTPSSVCGVRGTSFEVTQGEEAQISVLDGQVEVFNPEFPDQKISVGAGKRASVKQNTPPSAPVQIPAQDLQKLQQQEQVIFKKVQIPLSPEVVEQNSALVSEENGKKVVEYTVKIKNILQDKFSINLILLNEENEIVETVQMSFVSGGKNIEDVKTYSAKYTFTKPGKYTHRYKIVKK